MRRLRPLPAIRRRWSYCALLTLLLPGLALAGCGAGSGTGRDGTVSAGSPASPGPGRNGTTATTLEPAFVSEITPVTAADLGQSWRPGCPVGPDQLRRVRLSYRDFDDQPQVGTIVVHESVVADVITIFRTLYRAHFPIRRIQPVDTYGGSDDRSMADDNTSGFNCRQAVSTGPAKWSVHAYGAAIDVNPVENPYLIDGRVLPPAGTAYTDRADDRPGMAVPGGTLVEAFAAVGWHWGGEFRSPDHQHFSQHGG
ncbi:M15 family metallopeptidase [Plantactinospora sonchi]|uniref:M15 family metallopeptidase n=1 Tax=Plantactinospora sonchi TaxID=1544735 RepID=A0ABU7S0H6_9ACTN